MAPREHPPSRIQWFLLASAALSLAVAWGLALPIAGAAVLAFVSEGPIDAVLRRLRREHSRKMRWLVSVGFVTVILAGLLLPLTFATTAAVRELISVISSLQWESIAGYGTGYADAIRARLTNMGVEVPEAEVATRVRAALTTSFTFLGQKLGGLASSTPTVVFDLVILVFCWVVFAVEGRAARDRVLPKLLPWDREREILRETTADVLRSVLVANVMVSIAQSGLCTVGLLIVRTPRALVWGTLSFFLSFVPVVGTMPVTLGAAVYCYSQGRVGAAVFMVVIALAIGLVDNVIRPLFMKSSANLGFLWTFVAFVGGVALLGLPGVLVGPLAFSLFGAYLRAMEITAEGDDKPAPQEAKKAPAKEAPAKEEKGPEAASEGGTSGEEGHGDGAR